VESPLLGDVHAEARVLADEQAGSSCVVEMEVRQEQMPYVAHREASCLETSPQHGDGRGRTAIDEPRSVRRLDDVRAHHALAAAVQEVDRWIGAQRTTIKRSMTALYDLNGMRVLLISGETPDELEHMTSAVRAHLETRHEGLDALATRLRRLDHPRAHRRVVVASDAGAAAQALRTLDPQAVRTAQAESDAGAIAFALPGGGAQHPGMTGELYALSPLLRTHVDRCAEILDAQAGIDVRRALDPAASPSELERPLLGLCALFASEYALAQLWLSLGVRPAALIGHSLGEYTAATLAGVLTLEDALALVAARARLFEKLPSSAMLSIGLSGKEVTPLLGRGVSLAAVNAPSQCVVSGDVQAITRLHGRLEQSGVRVRRLRLSTAGHSSLVDEIVDEFAEATRSISVDRPSIQCISNVSGTWLSDDEALDPSYWVRHLRATVRFGDGVATLLTRARIVLEVGPGTTLSTLVRQAAAPLGGATTISSLGHPLDETPEAAALAAAAGEVWLTGTDVDWEAFASIGEEVGRQDAAGATAPSARRRHGSTETAEPSTPAAGSSQSRTQ
jgi:phthiocerol/phenolphthiocerol synthesis type-I polyketide synthase E